jgi:hypothetical protein
MRKLSTTEERLAELSKLREVPNSPTLRKELQKHLSSRVNLVVAKAAQIAGRLEDSSLVPDLIRLLTGIWLMRHRPTKGVSLRPRS